MSMSDTSTSRSSSKMEESAATVQVEKLPSPGRAARRQSKLKGILVRGMGIQQGSGGNHKISSNPATSLNSSSHHDKTTTARPILENQESSRIQQEHQAIMKRIETTTSRARQQMEKIRKDSLLKENKVRAEMEQLTKELTLIELDEAKRIKAVQEREANELEKLVRELKRI